MPRPLLTGLSGLLLFASVVAPVQGGMVADEALCPVKPSRMCPVEERSTTEKGAPTLPSAPLTSPLTPEKALDHLYAFDATPLGERIPVIVLPGRIQERQFTPWWRKLARATRNHPELLKQYKFYLFLYDSSEQLEDLTRAFSEELGVMEHWLPADRPIKVISYSLGGTIGRDAFVQHPELLAPVSIVYGLTVPYHGSPMFDPKWFARYLKHISPIREMWDRVTYRAYMSNKKNLLDGLHWVNFDQSQPSYLTRQQRRMASRGLLRRRPQPERRKMTLTSKSVEAYKRRLVIYASYLPNQYTNPEVKSRGVPIIGPIVGPVIKAPKVIVSAILPFYGPSVHSVFKYMNKQMANLPTYSPDNPNGTNEHLYRYNDGIIPLSSMMYLPPREAPYREDLAGLVAASDVCGLRIFEGTDHVDMGHYRWPPGILRTADVLHPEAGERTPIEWLLMDLGRRSCG